jgi:hypothetical protein
VSIPGDDVILCADGYVVDVNLCTPLVAVLGRGTLGDDTIGDGMLLTTLLLHDDV